MTRLQKILLAVALTLTAIGLIAISIRVASIRRFRPVPPVTLVGDVIKQDSDVTQQTPIPGVIVTASGGATVVAQRSGPSGFFSITLNPGVEKGTAVVLTFKHPDYKTLKITATNPGDQLYIARMEPLQSQQGAVSQKPETSGKVVQISNTRVRYTLKEQSTVNVGSLAKQFPAHNMGNIPCRGRLPCSPDGRWAATRTTLPLDAGQGNEFRNVRILCVAGPCAFTKIETDAAEHPAQKIVVSVLNWSDTTNFLVEADRMRTMVTDAVQQSYPFIIGQTMTFALPPGSEGPSIEADLDGQYIVFPLGPTLILSWATCSVEVSKEGNKIYRCQLKNGYRFQE
ncbi:MAG TPA: carboxypeptidase regulatory-like domain-containing protein [Bryobacteraceae bacterium]|nr:carboxypeptidase regulatory-like domain-containing protein [Bryobacteraceae bacterium]